MKIGSICDGVYDPSSDKCYKNNFEAPTCPGFATKNEPNGGRDAMGICPNPNTGFPQSVPCGSDGVHIDHVGKYACIFDKSPLNPDGSCPTGYVAGGSNPTDPCRIRIHDALPDGSCPPDYSHMPLGDLCKVSTDSSSGMQVDELPGGYCPIGYTHTATTQCTSIASIVLPGSTTGSSGGGFIKMLPANTTSKPTTTQTGNTGGSTGTTGGTSGTTTNTGGTTNTTKTPMKTGTTGTGGGTTTTTTNTKTTTTTTTPKQTGSTSGSTGTATSTSKATTTKIINNRNVVRGPSTSGGGGTTQAPTTPLITYVNTINKITIKYPSTWTKTELTGNPNIPVIFNPPTTITTTTATGNAGTAAAAKNSFVISITPSVSNLDNFTQQRIIALTHSNGVKYTITNTNAKVLTPPTGITAYREVSYNATKNILVNNTTIPTQVPLKGAAIYFVNSGTGYSLLYLAKQTEYTQNLPIIQQMINSFQIGNGGSTAASGSGVH